jgi:hypothetical protein
MSGLTVAKLSHSSSKTLKSSWTKVKIKLYDQFVPVNITDIDIKLIK